MVLCYTPELVQQSNISNATDNGTVAPHYFCEFIVGLAPY